ncbi:uncharacterized protein [Dermacentor albipictus]|uniref:uncharacterized protein isoform X2 n=1 Tax=Dermacentor albipictus TaxID=60249 RepID=UPI0038FC6A03
MYSDPQELEVDNLRKSRRLQRLPPEYGLQDLPRMPTRTASQTQETYGTGQPPASRVLHTPRWPRPFHARECPVAKGTEDGCPPIAQALAPRTCCPLVLNIPCGLGTVSKPAPYGKARQRRPFTSEARAPVAINQRGGTHHQAARQRQQREGSGAGS